MRTTPAPRSVRVPSPPSTIGLVAIALALAALGPLPAAVPIFASTAQAAGQDDPGDFFAEAPTWILDHRSGAGVRVTETSRSAPSRDARQFHTPGPTGYSPAQIRKAYEFDKLGNDGKRQIIGIVGAFDYPNAAADMKTFIKKFKLKDMYGLPGRKPCNPVNGPHPCFQVLYAAGVQPAFDEVWALESALDVQWAHAIAPGADILLVEAASNGIADLFLAANVASVVADVVSMSWGVPEFLGQSVLDVFFDVPGVTFVAASGDSGNAFIAYPAASPLVVAAGGTRLLLDKKGKRMEPETAWSNSGGGISSVVPEPGYQLAYPIPPTGGFRGAPDVAYNADPTTGFSVYSSHGFGGQTGWLVLGGTSAAAPQWAALFALANQRREAGNLSSNDLINRPIYDLARDDYRDLFFDIKTGTNGACGSVCTAATGYDFVTGLGSPRAKKLVDELDDY
jgi:subtilase family serine protease